MLARRVLSRGLCGVARSGKQGGYRPSTGYGYDPLADTDGGVTMIDAFSQTGFVVNGVNLKGSLLLLPHLSLLFDVPTLQHLTPQSLELFRLIDPPVELLLIGSGERVERIPPDAQRWLEQQAIAPEVFTSRTACSTFNFMVQERRAVAALMFPPRQPEAAVDPALLRLD